MSKVFEDYFMDVQAGMIALCKELAKNTIHEAIFVYGSIEKSAVSFNAFYLSQGEVVTASKIANNPAMIKQFLRLGSSDLIKLAEICKKYNRPVPTELRLRYITANRHLDTHYEYKSICGSENNITSQEVFQAWKESVEKEIENDHGI